MNENAKTSETQESADVPMIKIQTTRFGDIEVPEESVIDFPEGVVGFKEARRFVIFDCGGDGILKWLQAVDLPDVAFIICESRLIVPDYKVLLGEMERQTLQLENADDAVVCLILIIPDDFQETTANLLGPIVMNSEKRIGMQLVLVNPEYSARQKVFKASPQATSGEGANAGS